MEIKTEDYSIESVDNTKSVIAGILRLTSPAAYEKDFEHIQKGITDSSTGYTVDIANVNFMNSSGITALSRLVLLARQGNKSLTLVINESIPWQKKTISSLKKLYEKLEIRS